jgi:hypothetical protein
MAIGTPLAFMTKITRLEEKLVLNPNQMLRLYQDIQRQDQQ